MAMGPVHLGMLLRCPRSAITMSVRLKLCICDELKYLFWLRLPRIDILLSVFPPFFYLDCSSRLSLLILTTIISCICVSVRVLCKIRTRNYSFCYYGFTWNGSPQSLNVIVVVWGSAKNVAPPQLMASPSER